MKSISLYVDKDTWLTRMHPFTKLCYILTAISVSLISGNLLAFGIFIGISLVMLISGKIIQGFSTDCFFFYNSDYDLSDTRVI